MRGDLFQEIGQEASGQEVMPSIIAPHRLVTIGSKTVEKMQVGIYNTQSG